MSLLGWCGCWCVVHLHFDEGLGIYLFPLSQNFDQLHSETRRKSHLGCTGLTDAKWSRAYSMFSSRTWTETPTITFPQGAGFVPPQPRRGEILQSRVNSHVFHRTQLGVRPMRLVPSARSVYISPRHHRTVSAFLTDRLRSEDFAPSTATRPRTPPLALSDRTTSSQDLRAGPRLLLVHLNSCHPVRAG
jgi:hypothetical protein